MALTKTHNRMIAGAPVTPEDFGAVGDGVTNDIDALIAAHNTGRDVQYSNGKTYYVEPSIGDYSKAIPIYREQIVDWNNCKILCTNGAKTVYLIDARANIPSPPQHINNIHCRNVLIKSLRTGFTGLENMDFEHFLTVRGGYIMMSSFTNFSGVRDGDGTSLSCRSIIYFDLNDPNGTSDVGAPDGITISDMYFLSAYGTSSIVLLDGSTTTAAGPSRVGKIRFENYVLGCINPLDFDDHTLKTGKQGAIIANACNIGYSTMDFVFGGVRSFIALNGSAIENTTMRHVYNEVINPQSSGNRAVIYTDAASYLHNCLIDYADLYVLGNNFTPPASFNLIDAVAYDCHIQKPEVYENEQDISLLPSDLINLKGSSLGNTIDRIRTWLPATSGLQKSDVWQKWVTAPAGTKLGTFADPYSDRLRGLTVPSGTTTLFTIPADLIEYKDTIEVKVIGVATSGTFRVRCNVSTSIQSAETTFSASNDVHEVNGSMYLYTGTDAAKANQAIASMDGVFMTQHDGGNFANGPTAGVYTRGNNLVITVVTSGTVLIDFAEVTVRRGNFSTIT